MTTERVGAAVVVFRVVTVLHAVQTVGQAIAAGAVLQASTIGLIVHQAGAAALWLVALVQVGAAVVAWRPGRLPAWPIAVSVGLVVAETAQVAVGATGVLAVHVPLGVVIVVTAVGLAAWALRARPRTPARSRASTTPTTPTTPTPDASPPTGTRTR